jgi:hypothetical protein
MGSQRLITEKWLMEICIFTGLIIGKLFQYDLLYEKTEKIMGPFTSVKHIFVVLHISNAKTNHNSEVK